MLGISGRSRVGPLGSLLPALPSFVPPPVSGEFEIKVHNRGAIFTGYPATTERAEVPVRREGSHLSLLLIPRHAYLGLGLRCIIRFLV
jgi:hypothetical protein